MSGILLDTNVLSELMRPAPAPEVLSWFAGQRDAAFFISAVTRAELLLGIALLPAGKRRDGLAAAAEQMFEEDFVGHCLPFDEACATEYAVLVAGRIRQGLPVSAEDGQIAATAVRHNFPLATRNIRDFTNITGLTLLNPWA